ncbi:hypothetical protein N9T25_01970 [Candidatus Pelagibacter sp.]|nr:hypothetical protein [Candidatus Pelagibacter sp.]
MKRSLLILILMFSFQSLSKADDIRDFEIEGISVGDILLNHTKTIGVTKKYILDKDFRFYPGSRRLALLAFSDRGNYTTYYKIQVTVNPNDYKIYRVGGFIKILNKNDCLNKQKRIIEDLENSFISFEKLNNVEFTSHPADKSGKSVANGIYLDLPSGDTAMVECYIWSKEYKEKHGGHKDNLRVTLSNKDGNDFVNNEAYK